VLTESIYPLKINEYLLFGIPVISSNFSKDIYTFSNEIKLSENHEEFLENIEIALQEDSKERRLQLIEIGKSNTWKERIQEFKKLIREKIEEKRL
jgi:hypothetical protein